MKKTQNQNDKIPWSHFKWIIDLSLMMQSAGLALTEVRIHAAYIMFIEGKSLQETMNYLAALPAKHGASV